MRMLREEAIEKWVIPALKRTWNEKRCKEIIEALEQEPCIQEKQANADKIDAVYIDGFKAGYSQARFDLEQEPCDDVCEWFEQCVDIATDIVEIRFSDGTVKRAKRGLYLRDIEKSIRKMLIDQIANEKKQESKWIPVKEKIEKKISEIEAQIPDDIGEHVVGYDKQLGALEAYREMLKEVV